MHKSQSFQRFQSPSTPPLVAALYSYERPLAAYGAGRKHPPAGTCKVPLSAPSACRVDPFRGLRPPLPTAAAPPRISQEAEGFGSGHILGDRVMEMYQNGICVASRANTGYLRRGSASGFWSVVLRMILGTDLACGRYRHRVLLTRLSSCAAWAVSTGGVSRNRRFFR